MHFGDVSFTVASHAAWLPGLGSSTESTPAWQRWIEGEACAAASGEPVVPAEPLLKHMPPMLRRRASPAGKLALEAAYAVCTTLPATIDADAALTMPVVFASRHGECARSVELLQALAAPDTSPDHSPLSPTAFSLSVHNAAAGLFSIARRARGNAIAIAAGASTIEHAVIEACGLLADGAPQVLLVAADDALPTQFAAFADGRDTPYGWAWLMQAADEDSEFPACSLQWRQATDATASATTPAAPGGLDILRWFMAPQAGTGLVRQADGRQWHWMRHA